MELLILTRKNLKLSFISWVPDPDYQVSGLRVVVDVIQSKIQEGWGILISDADRVSKKNQFHLS